MGAAESQHDNGMQRDSGGISDLISLDNVPWWGEGLSKESGQQNQPGGKAGEKSVIQTLAEPGHYFGEQHDMVSGRKKTEHYSVDHQEVVRPRTLQFDEAPREKKFEDELQSQIGSGSQNGSEQYYEEEEDEADNEGGKVDAGKTDEQLSRLVGRDGYLLPFATTSYHMNVIAKLHRLHHQVSRVDQDHFHKDDRLQHSENLFFRAPMECPGWLPGGRYLGHEDAKEAVMDLQSREQAQARVSRAKVIKTAAVAAKREKDRNLKDIACRLALRFNERAYAVREERSTYAEEAQDMAARRCFSSKWKDQLKFSLDTFEQQSEKYFKAKPRLTKAEETTAFSFEHKALSHRGQARTAFAE